MKQASIRVGGQFTDDKMGLREVLELGSHVPTSGEDKDAVGVRYLVISAAKSTDIGECSQMELASFASWARRELSIVEATEFKLSVEGAKVARRITPQQREFFLHLNHDTTADSTIRFRRAELRVAKSLLKRLLVVNEPQATGDDQFSMNLTPLGIAVLAAVHSESPAKL